MDSVSSWLLSIAGVILLSVLAEFILPDGQINKFVRIIFSFVVLLVIILPLPKIFKNNFNLSNYLSGQTTLQSDYLEQVNLDKLNAITQETNEKIRKKGLYNVEVYISANIFAEKLEIYTITVDLRKIEYDDRVENKTIENAKAIILQVLKQDENLKDVGVRFRE